MKLPYRTNEMKESEDETIFASVLVLSMFSLGIVGCAEKRLLQKRRKSLRLAEQRRLRKKSKSSRPATILRPCRSNSSARREDESQSQSSCTFARTRLILRPERVGGKRTHVATVGRSEHLTRKGNRYANCNNEQKWTRMSSRRQEATHLETCSRARSSAWLAISWS